MRVFVSFNELELFVDEKSEKKCATLFEHPDCDGFTIDMERNENINVLDGKRKMVRALLLACLTYFVMLLDDRIFQISSALVFPKCELSLYTKVFQDKVS